MFLVISSYSDWLQQIMTTVSEKLWRHLIYVETCYTGTNASSLLTNLDSMAMYVFGKSWIYQVPQFLKKSKTNWESSRGGDRWTLIILGFLNLSWRCPWCNGYRHRKWTRRHKFKSSTRLIGFHIALIPLGKVWIKLFSLQLWVNSRADWVIQPWWSN